MPDDLEQQVIDIIARKQHLEPSRVTLDATFEHLGIDSLDGLDLMFTFEETFHLKIPDDLALHVKAVRDVVEALRALQADATAEAS